MNNYFILHHTDHDGLMAAAAVVLHIRNTNKPNDYRIHTFAMNYGDAIPAELKHAEGICYIVDFCPEADQLIQICDQLAGQVFVYDHHKTAVEKLERAYLHVRNFGANNLEYKITGDMAGCDLTYTSLHKTTLPPRCIQLVADRDLWEFEYGKDTKAYHAYLNTLPQTVEAFTDELVSNLLCVSLADEIRIGESILAVLQNQIERDAKRAMLVNYDGRYTWCREHRMSSSIKAITVNATNNISDLANYLLDEHPEADIAAVYTIETAWGSSVRVSLRSRAGGPYDVAEIAKQYGGGGHKNAAGFTFTQAMFSSSGIPLISEVKE